MWQQRLFSIARESPNQSGIVSIRRDHAAEGRNGGRVGTTVVTNKPVRLDLIGKVKPRSRKVLVQTGPRRHRIENIDNHRGEESVHLQLRIIEMLGLGIGYKPITGDLLVCPEARS